MGKGKYIQQKIGIRENKIQIPEETIPIIFFKVNPIQWS